ncbi:SRPBCC domain-containing protein [Micromonospora sp. R77]|uniref:SRPBCC domain-containing protein n=1 Tax=Micromonospora sp. R77 TaxID=2925836 RepID=UPI001F611D72|nr:SRPBCC domain-containing protein [Micromonospora sp. R77]MCI4065585.1 SRPBCC domain-containing protein [Micromonospora sp. R77]
MRTIDTSITISSPPERVWEILTDLPRYQEWNPFVRRAAGRPAVGEALTLFIQPPGEKGMTHHPTVTVAEPARQFQWLGKVAVPGLFGARHEFVLEAAAGGTLVRHRETFTGLLVPFLKRTLDRTELGFDQLNRALKERAETIVD